MRALHTLSLLLLLTLGLAGAAAGSEAPGVCEPDPTCEKTCRYRARDAIRACMDSGDSVSACRERAWKLRDACIASECRPTLGCEERCKAHAKRLLHECLDLGEDATRCEADARLAHEHCVERKCERCDCPRNYAPVCGVDGMTYSNVCEAGCAGVDVAREGPCEPRCLPVLCRAECEFGYKKDARGCPTCECNPPPGCRSDDECRPDQVCRELCPGAPCRLDLETGESFCPPCVGVCVPKTPCLCTHQYDPVCGVDGRTYSNACFARCAGVDVGHRGPCAPTCEPTVCPAFCSQGQPRVEMRDGCPTCDCIEGDVFELQPLGGVLELQP